MEIEFGRTSGDYARHRAGFPDRFYDRLAAMNVLRAGIRALDLGTGTGTLARGLARRGLEVTGLDRSAEMIVQARSLDAEARVATRYLVASAEQSGLPDRSFDLVTAGQCWHWFDRARAALEARRLLVPGGRIVIAHFDWIPLAGNVVDATEQLIMKHNSAWRLNGGIGIHPAWLRDLQEGGFQNIETFSFDLDVPYSHEAWRGRIRASAGVGASLQPDQVARFDDELRVTLAARFPSDPLAVFHRVFAVIATSPQVRQPQEAPA
jgi:SAM-dependent methyltransferase